MILLSDDLGRIITLGKTPQRIVSLVPSITLTIFDLGCGKKLVGRTKFCIHPFEKVKEISVVGGTKSVHIDKIIALNPDLVIANKEENTEEDINDLAAKIPVFITDISNFEDNSRLLSNLGTLLNVEEKAAELQKKIEEGFAGLKYTGRPIRTLYVIWQKPYMSIGNDTFIHSAMQMAGFENVFRDAARYPAFTIEAAKQLDPELILLSSEPFPFREKHIAAFRENFPCAKIMLADGEMFSWYGSRMAEAAEYLASLLRSIR